jgi:2'-hydroxyisoflavone reductase
MHLLILGGTIFVGRHVTEAALQAGHSVTLFNRGQHGRGLFAAAERLVGDRDADASALRERDFDAVIDCNAYTPAQVGRVVEAMGDRLPHVVFVSTLSVYGRWPAHRPYDESRPVAAERDDYGGLKARAEQAIAAAAAGRLAIVRPGLVAGPHDPTGRFTYWPLRAERGGEALAPGRPERPVQFIDARDLAAFIVLLAERHACGLFNAVGPPQPMADLLRACAEATGFEPGHVRWRWVPDARLAAAGVEPWTELPLWLPEDDPEVGGMLLADASRARAQGLRTRDARATCADTLRWALAEGAGPGEGTLAPAREAAILAAAGA